MEKSVQLGQEIVMREQIEELKLKLSIASGTDVENEYLKNKFKLREKELVDVIEDKDKQIKYLNGRVVDLMKHLECKKCDKKSQIIFDLENQIEKLVQEREKLVSSEKNINGLPVFNSELDYKNEVKQLRTEKNELVLKNKILLEQFEKRVFEFKTMSEKLENEKKFLQTELNSLSTGSRNGTKKIVKQKISNEEQINENYNVKISEYSSVNNKRSREIINKEKREKLKHKQQTEDLKNENTENKSVAIKKSCRNNINQEKNDKLKDKQENYNLTYENLEVPSTHKNGMRLGGSRKQSEEFVDNQKEKDNPLIRRSSRVLRNFVNDNRNKGKNN